MPAGTLVSTPTDRGFVAGEDHSSLCRAVNSRELDAYVSVDYALNASYDVVLRLNASYESRPRMRYIVSCSKGRYVVVSMMCFSLLAYYPQLDILASMVSPGSRFLTCWLLYKLEWFKMLALFFLQPDLFNLSIVQEDRLFGHKMPSVTT